MEARLEHQGTQLEQVATPPAHNVKTALPANIASETIFFATFRRLGLNFLLTSILYFA